MDILIDSVKVIGRIVTILPFLLFLGLYMGKRSIGELPVFDFLVILVLGAVVGADIADPKINHIHTVVAMIAIAFLQKLVVYLKLKNRKIGRLLTFEPTIVLYKGEFLTENMKSVNYSIDNVLQMLREKEVFQAADVEIAIVEANGRLSVSLSPDKQPVRLSDMNITGKEAEFEIPVILDGQIQNEALKKLKKDKDWLVKQLKDKDKQISDESDIFYAGVNLKGNLNFTIKGRIKPDVPPIFH